MRLRELARPDGMVVTLVVRRRQVVIPRGATALEPGDHVFVALRSHVKPLIDRLFSPEAMEQPLPTDLDLSFPAHTTLGQLKRFFALAEPLAPAAAAHTLGHLLEQRQAGVCARFGPLGIEAGVDPDGVRVRASSAPVQTARAAG